MNAPLKNFKDLETVQVINKALPLRQRPCRSGRQVLVCHDMAGGYHQDAVIQGSTESHLNYYFNYWSLIDTFVYFSHYRITIPPVNWINAAHKNGVEVYGTIITEWDDIEETKRLFYGPNYSPLLPSTCFKFSPFYADLLVTCALDHGFEGWLVNIECSISPIDVIVLQQFLNYFKQKLEEHHLKLMWYDSIIQTGELKWQNGLTSKNKEFIKVCHSMFMNYGWKPETLKEPSFDIYMGIDCWGRGTFGGGGYNVHKAIRELTDFSIAIFAPAFVLESVPGDFAVNQDRFWIDTRLKLPIEFTSRNETTVPDNKDIGCIGQYIAPRAVPMGTIYTNFDQGIGDYYLNGKKVDSRYHLSRTSLQPSYYDAPVSLSPCYSGDSVLLVPGDVECKVFKTNYNVTTQTIVQVRYCGIAPLKLKCYYGDVCITQELPIPKEKYEMVQCHLPVGELTKLSFIHHDKMIVSVDSILITDELVETKQLRVGFIVKDGYIEWPAQKGDERIVYFDHVFVGLAFCDKWFTDTIPKTIQVHVYSLGQCISILEGNILVSGENQS